MVRNDHGSMAYQRMSEGESGPAVIRNDRRPLGKRLASKQAAAAVAAATAAVSTESRSPVQSSGSRTASPVARSPLSLQPDEADRPIVKCKGLKVAFIDVFLFKFGYSRPAVKLVIKKDGDKSVVTSNSTSPANKTADLVVVELTETGRQREVAPATCQVQTKDEAMDEEDTGTITTSTEPQIEMEDYLVRPRRCGRLQKEEVLKQHDSDACPLGETYFDDVLDASLLIEVVFFFCFRRARHQQAAVLCANQREEELPVLHASQ